MSLSLAENVIVAGADNLPPMLDKTMYSSWASRMILYIKGLPQDIYNLMNHREEAKDIWDRVKLLIEGSEISMQEKESKLYDEFDTCTSVPGETIHSYYMRSRRVWETLRNATIPKTRFVTRYMARSSFLLSLVFTKSVFSKPLWGLCNGDISIELKCVPFIDFEFVTA
ncbi:hypothetical protein Tco_0277191 [Tanacetum coccineum]